MIGALILFATLIILLQQRNQRGRKQPRNGRENRRAPFRGGSTQDRGYGKENTMYDGKQTSRRSSLGITQQQLNSTLEERLHLPKDPERIRIRLERYRRNPDFLEWDLEEGVLRTDHVIVVLREIERIAVRRERQRSP